MEAQTKADAAIRDHVGFAMFGAMIPIPIADIAAVTVIQLDLIKQLADIYSMKYDQTSGKAIVSALTGATAARLGASAAKVIPGVGTIIGGGTQIVLSGASTYAVGKLFKRHFEAEGTIDTFNPDAAKDLYESYVEKGKDVASTLKEKVSAFGEPTVEDIVSTVDKLSRLRASGSLTNEEFERLKQKLLEQF